MWMMNIPPSAPPPETQLLIYSQIWTFVSSNRDAVWENVCIFLQTSARLECFSSQKPPPPPRPSCHLIPQPALPVTLLLASRQLWRVVVVVARFPNFMMTAFTLCVSIYILFINSIITFKLKCSYSPTSGHFEGNYWTDTKTLISSRLFWDNHALLNLSINGNPRNPTMGRVSPRDSGGNGVANCECSMAGTQSSRAAIQPVGQKIRLDHGPAGLGWWPLLEGSVVASKYVQLLIPWELAD